MAFPETSFARMLLFDRLVDHAPGQSYETPPLRMLDAAGLQNSVSNELLRLFNIRSATQSTGSLSIIDYGLPDWSALYASNPDHRKQIERSVVNAILAFEPRLCHPQAMVDIVPQRQQTLSIRVTGNLSSDRENWPVSFRMALAPTGAELTLEDGKQV